MASTPASVSALLKPRTNVGRNAFPLDHRQVFSIKAGQITPVKALKFVPNDHFSIDVSEFGITMPMNTAPFLRGRKETVFYSVYNSAVWSLFNQYIAQRSDPKTSALNTNLHEPRIALWELYKGCIAQLYFYTMIKYVYPAIVRSEHRATPIVDWQSYYDSKILDFLEQGWQSSFVFEHPDFPLNISNFPGYRNVDFSLSYTSSAFAGNPNPTNRDFCQDIVGQYRVFNWCRKLDMLGYGNVNPVFNDYLNTCEELFNDVDYWDDNALNAFIGSISLRFKSIVLFPLVLSTVLFDSYTSSGEPSANAQPTYDYKNLYPICGYNLIFYHFFRNSFYDLNYYTRDYNLDFISVYNNDVPNTSLNIVKLAEFSLRFLDIEYHQWKKDTFTGVLPDTQFGAVSSLQISNSIASDGPLGFSRFDGQPMQYDSVQTYSSLPYLYNGIPDSQNILSYKEGLKVSSSFDVIALKRAEILQDYRQTLMRAGNKTSDVFKALYGGAPSSEHEDDIIPRFLDTFGTDIFIDPVTATANTEQGNNGTLGDLSARGKFSGRSGHIKFNSGNNFGVLFCLTYFVPTAEYNSYFIDPANNCLNPEDHYISNFENMGLEPVYSDELNNLKSRQNLAVLGYAPRYHYLKSQVDVVHGDFVSMPSRYRDLTGVYSYRGAFNIWVAPRTDLQNRSNTMVRDFYVNPSILDNIFVNQVDATQSSDHVICNYYLDIKATRGMSKVGLLNFV